MTVLGLSSDATEVLNPKLGCNPSNGAKIEIYPQAGRRNPPTRHRYTHGRSLRLTRAGAMSL